MSTVQRNSTKPCWNTKFTCAYKDPVCVHLINGRNGSRRWPIRLNSTVTWLLDVCNLVVSCSRLRYRLRLNRPGLLRGKREFAGRMLIILWQCAHSLVSRAYFSRMPCDIVKNRVWTHSLGILGLNNKVYCHVVVPIRMLREVYYNYTVIIDSQFADFRVLNTFSC